MDGFHPLPPTLGLMGPPPLPTHKTTDICTLEDPLVGTGVNLDEEERILTTPIFYTQRGSWHQNNHEGSTANLQRRAEAGADFSAGRWAQHPLWDAFLQGDALEKKLNEYSYKIGIKVPNDGLFYATKAQSRPQIIRVTGHDGASRIIDRGQAILSTNSGNVLGDIMTLLSLAAKERVTGLLDHSACLACEWRDYSSGRIPTEWKMVASASSQPTGTKSLKRELSFFPLNLLTC